MDVRFTRYNAGDAKGMLLKIRRDIERESYYINL